MYIYTEKLNKKRIDYVISDKLMEILKEMRVARNQRRLVKSLLYMRDKGTIKVSKM